MELESNSKSVEQKKNQGETLSSGDNDGKTIGQQPILLHLGSGDGRVAVAAAHLNICSSAVGVDINPQLITASKQLAFQKKVFNKCHFFEEDLTVDPKILLDNPHWIADKMNESDVVFLHVDPKMLKKLIPLLARLSNGRKIVTLMNHLPKEASICPEFIHGTELCVYDGVIDNRDAVEQILPPPPEPVDADDIDKEFARRSIQHALPSKF